MPLDVTWWILCFVAAASYFWLSFAVAALVFGPTSRFGVRTLLLIITLGALTLGANSLLLR